MHVIIGILASQGVMRFVDLFGGFHITVECLIAGLSAGIITFLLLRWKRGNSK